MSPTNVSGYSDSLSRHYLSKHADKTNPGDSNAQSAPRMKRVLRACKRCNSSKVRCDGGSPCARCAPSMADCVYEPSKIRRRKIKANARQSTPQSPTISIEAMAQQRGDATNGSDSTFSPLDVPITHNHADNIMQHSKDDGRYPSEAPCQPTVIEQLIDYNTDFSAESFDIGLWSGGLEEPMNSAFFYGPSDAMSLDPMLNFAWLTENNAPVYIDNLPTPQHEINYQLSPSSMAETYRKIQVPRLDQDCIEPRIYKPRSIEVDAPLAFPDMTNIPIEDLDDEDHAHVDHVTEAYFEPVSALSDEMEKSGYFPAWQNLQIPPVRLLNVWVQLFFEHFHPILPINHKPTFSQSKPHCILLFVMAAIGARYSKIHNAYPCALAMHELVRRQTSYMVCLL